MSKPIITVKSLSKSFRHVKRGKGVIAGLKSLLKPKYLTVNALKEFDFEIHEGEIVGFIGANGAGKTTMMKILSGLMHPDEGEVTVAGFVPWKRDKQFLKETSLIMGQKRQLWWDLPVVDTFKLHQKIYQISEEDYQSRVSLLVEEFELGDLVNKDVRSLSLGERMRCEIALSLLHSPKVLFLDEPTIGLDIHIQRKIRNFLKGFNERFNTTILLTSHYMEDISDLCSRVLVIKDGGIIYDGKVRELIDRYAHEKRIYLKFKQSVDPNDIAKFGKIIESEERNITIEVARSEATKVAAKILEGFDVEEMDIMEASLEDVVEGIFK